MQHKTTDAEHIAFLEAVIDTLVLCVTTVGGDPFTTREAFYESMTGPGVPTDYSYEEFIMDSTDDAIPAEKIEPENAPRTHNATSSAYEIVSWTAIIESKRGDDTVSITVNIEHLRDLVNEADAAWALLVAREGGNA